MKNELTAALTKPKVASGAASVYGARQANIAELLDRVSRAAEAHRALAAERPGDWCFPGDLSRVEAHLAQALAILGDRSACDDLGIEW